MPIIYESTELNFESNGLGRLRDCLSCVVTEERNVGIYECDFTYPVSGANYDLIKVGRIIGVTHDDTGNIQPFDIVSYTRPIDGVVTFHCVHVSYRLNYLTVNGTNISNISDALAMLGDAVPSNPFTFRSVVPGTGYLAVADGIPKTARSVLGGTEGSILDIYGGEYEWDRFEVILHPARGKDRDFSIRYGVNMLDYNEELDSQGTYMSCIPYWTDGTQQVVGDRQNASGYTVTNRGECVPLDVSDKFESKPTKAQVNAMGLSVMNSRNVTIPSQTIHIEFARLQDMGYAELSNLYTCRLCDTINVVFPDYDAAKRFKIVKTVWDVLADRYESMELGDLSVTLAEALGISSGLSESALITETPTLSFTTTTGTLKSYSCRRFGNVVQLRLTFNNASTVASGANIYEGTLDTTALRPKAVVSGGSYFGAHAIGALLNTVGSITIRNASSSSVTISGDNTATVSFTYIL